MRSILLAVGIVALTAGAAVSQDAATPHGQHAGAASPMVPPECAAAAGDGTGMSHGAYAKSMAGMEMDPAQRAYMDGMDAMSGPMAAAHRIKDPDLAFACGMIAHHQGAIAMSRVVLEYGKDAANKALATRIIAAQEQEIAEMTDWVKAHGGK
jgi:uncharacterized protein (DUF305 family)